MNTQDTRPTISPPAEALTVRQQFVLAAMRGLCSRPEIRIMELAPAAREIADRVIAEEERTREGDSK